MPPPRPRPEPPRELDRGPELPRVPGLAGLRALALGAVLVFSQGFDLGRGGFLGISSAFTLSGFLLATLSLAEWSQTSRLQVGRFWERRARKLVPLTLLTVATAVVLQVAVGVGSVPTFRGDTLAALSFTTNWRLAFPAEGFARSFAELSSLRHLWPVAITAQAFLLFPLVFMLLMFVTGRQWRIAGALFGVGALASFAVAWRMSGDPDTRDLAYYGTHTRIGEMLVGVVLGYAVLSPAFRRLLSRPRVLPVVRYGALVCLAGLLALWTFMPYESDWVFHGGTALNAVLTAWVILAVTIPGPAPSLLGLWPLRELGEISFAAYLLHWPLYLLLDEDRLGLEGPALFGVRVVATVALAALVTWAVERPFQWTIALPRLQLGGLFAGTAVALLAVVFVLPVNPPNGISLTIDDGNGPGDLDVVTPAGGTEAARILVVGDQLGGSLIPGFQAWDESPDHRADGLRIDTHVTPSCPIGGPGEIISLGQKIDASDDCEAWRLRLPKTLDAAKPDAILVVMGVGDLGERKIGRDWLHLGDPGYDRWLAGQIDQTADVLAEAGVPVVWATAPHVRADDDDPATSWPAFDDNDPRRIDELNQLIIGTVGDRDGFTTVDLDAWLHDVPRGEFNPDLRSGVEFTAIGATDAVAWLAPQLLAAAEG